MRTIEDWLGHPASFEGFRFCAQRQGWPSVIQQAVPQVGKLNAQSRLQARALAWQLIGMPEQAAWMTAGCCRCRLIGPTVRSDYKEPLDASQSPARTDQRR